MVDLSLTDDIFVESEIDAAIQELDILFNTTPTELLGDYNYGSNFLQFLWSLTPMQDTLRTYVNERINGFTVFASSFKRSVDVVVYEDVNETIYVIQITLYDTHDNEYYKEYTIKS